VLQYVAVCCSVLQCLAAKVCCRALPCVVVCCSVLQRDRLRRISQREDATEMPTHLLLNPTIEECAVACCSVLYRAAACCSVLRCSLLQYVAVCCSDSTMEECGADWQRCVAVCCSV